MQPIEDRIVRLARRLSAQLRENRRLEQPIKEALGRWFHDRHGWR